jgi:hypothetical protein
MSIFRRKVPSHYVPIQSDNLGKKDWIILLEAGTIVGPSQDKLRVALATTDRKVVTRYNLFLRKTHYLVIEGYDPRIHALYLCPQLYKYDSDRKLVALEGDEIGGLVASSVEDGVVKRPPWYEPANKLPAPIISAVAKTQFDTVVVDLPATSEHDQEASKAPSNP